MSSALIGKINDPTGRPYYDYPIRPPSLYEIRILLCAVSLVYHIICDRSLCRGLGQLLRLLCVCATRLFDGDFTAAVVVFVRRLLLLLVLLLHFYFFFLRTLWLCSVFRQIDRARFIMVVRWGTAAVPTRWVAKQQTLGPRLW